MNFSPNFPDDFNDGVSLMILGNATSTNEEILGIPLVDTGGELLLSSLVELNFNRNNLYISNVFWEVPDGNLLDYFYCDISSGTQRAEQFPLYKSKYLKKEWENQIYRLQDEIELIKPYLILTLGDIPLWALAGQHDLTSLRGQPKIISGPVKYKYSIMFPTHHPDSALADQKIMDEFVRDLLRMAELLDTPAWEWPNMFGEEYNAAFRN